MSQLAELPLPYFLSLGAVLFLLIKGWSIRAQGTGIPMIVVAATIGSWYLIDPLYNDYNQYISEVGALTLATAWWEVFLFLVAFAVAVPLVHSLVNRDWDDRESTICEMIANEGITRPAFQDQVDACGSIILVAWAIFMLFALWRTNFDFAGIFFPYLSDKDDPWSRDRIGTGFDFMIAFAGYIQIMFTMFLGIIFAISRRTQIFFLSGISYLLAVPFYLFDRTRNTMLAVLLPGFMFLVALRIRRGIFLRLAVLLLGFILINGWLKFVIASRDKESIAMAFEEEEVQKKDFTQTKHLGFNMFEELGYINYLIENGTYRPNWGQRYFAELVNPIPRSIWAGKPLIGIDYAVARGMAYGNQSSSSAGVAASISTGMIGQGVVNFGGFFGPVAAASIMAFWVAVLARQDLMGGDLWHLLLYAMGLVLTFNMGRDITLLVIYPFVFGWLLVKLLSRHRTPNIHDVYAA